MGEFENSVIEKMNEKTKQNIIMDIELSGGYESSDNEIKAEIDNILGNIQHNDIDLESLEDIDEIREMAIDKVFKSYMVYEKNKQNKQTAREELKHYRFVDIADLQKGDFVRYFNLTQFFDLKLVMGGTIMDLDYEGTGDIIVFAPYGIKRIKPNIFFQKIKTDDLLKMKLIQIANKINTI